MSYSAIGKIANSQGLTRRVSGCAAQEGVPSPQMWVMNNMYTIAASPGWAEAWEAAEDVQTEDTNPDIGARSDVITDGMIIAAVQPLASQAVV